MIGEGAVDVFGDLYEHRMICAFMYADGYAINFETFFPDDFILLISPLKKSVTGKKVAVS
jgi:hypothetical protein